MEVNWIPWITSFKLSYWWLLNVFYCGDLVNCHWPVYGYLLCNKDPDNICILYIILKVGKIVIVLFYVFKYFIVSAIFTSSSSFNILLMISIIKLNGTKY